MGTPSGRNLNARELREAAAAEAVQRWPDSALDHAQLDGYTFDSRHVYEMQRRAFAWGAQWAHERNPDVAECGKVERSIGTDRSHCARPVGHAGIHASRTGSQW